VLGGRTARNARRDLRLTGAKCTPNTIHWTYDTWALANGTGQAIVKTGGDTWFFLPVAYQLYLPKEWAQDRARRRKAGVPKEISFKTKPPGG
jgi:hypothetical protein